MIHNIEILWFVNSTVTGLTVPGHAHIISFLKKISAPKKKNNRDISTKFPMTWYF